MLSQRAGIGVAFLAALNLTRVRFLKHTGNKQTGAVIQECTCTTFGHLKVLNSVFQVQTHHVNMRALVLGTVAGVAEGFLTARVLTQVRLLTCVTAQVDLQVLQARECFITALKLQGGRERKNKIQSNKDKNRLKNRESEMNSERKEVRQKKTDRRGDEGTQTKKQRKRDRES